MIDMTRQMLHRVSNLNHENERISYQMSTGKVLDNGSDDATLYAKVLNIEDNLRIYEGLKTQIDKTAAQNSVADTTLGEIKGSVDMVKLDIMKALNQGMDVSSRTALSTNLKGIRENLFTLVNTNVDGQYVYAGSDTTKQTFQKDVDFDKNGKVTFGGNGLLRNVAVEPKTYRDRGITGYDVLMYNTSTAGDSEQLSFKESERVIDSDGLEWKLNGAKDKIQKYDKGGNLTNPVIEKSVTDDGATPPTYTTNAGEITGSEFFKTKHNFFDDLNIAINALEGYSTKLDGTKDAKISTEDMDKLLRNSLEQTSKQYTASNIGHAELGGRNKIFEIALERIEAKNVHYNILMQKTSGADMSKLAMESKSLEMTYQALYSTISKMHSLSLLNYIK